MQSALQNPLAQSTIGFVILVTVALLIHLVARPFIIRLTQSLVQRTRSEWDGVFFNAKVPHRVSLLIPLLAFRAGLAWVPGLSLEVTDFLARMIAALMVLVFALTVASVINAIHEVYVRTMAERARPIKSYVQLTNLVIYSVAAIFIVARLAGQSPWFFVSGLGAIMAIILLIFRDTLLSLVASVQLTGNDVIRVGDWIEMPQFEADGDVIDIALNTVTVENWDKTITVIPTHKFLEHSFKNWRNMFERGGRRIKRAIHINISTIRFLTDAEIEKLSRFALLKDYMETRLAEIAEYNAAHGVDASTIVNGRRLTNMGTLRAYVTAYLRNHPLIHNELTFLVRQLAPTPEGLPLEIYVFTTDTRWSAYEGIQADIFDHILSIIPEFGLKVYQRPAGGDIEGIAEEGGTLKIYAGAATGV